MVHVMWIRIGLGFGVSWSIRKSSVSNIVVLYVSGCILFTTEKLKKKAITSYIFTSISVITSTLYGKNLLLTCQSCSIFRVSWVIVVRVKCRIVHMRVSEKWFAFYGAWSCRFSFILKLFKGILGLILKQWRVVFKSTKQYEYKTFYRRILIFTYMYHESADLFKIIYSSSLNSK